MKTGDAGGPDADPSHGPPQPPDSPANRGYRNDRSDRGVSSILALILLIGVVAIGSIGILVIGGQALEDTKGQTETERVELSFMRFGSQIDSIAVSEGSSRTIDMSLPDDSDGLVTEERSTRVVVTRYNGTSTEVVNHTIGSIVYRSDDSQYTYEAGAIWRGSGTSTQIVSPPEVTYRNATLTLPVTDLQGQDTITSGRIRSTKNETFAPLNDVSIVRGELITVKITSNYYIGWANYFRNTVGNVSVNVDHATETVTIRLAEPVIDGSLDTGIVAAGDVYATNPSETPETNVKTSGDIHGTIDCASGCEENLGSVGVESIDAAVEVRTTAEKQAAGGSYTTINGGETLTNGSYYVPNDTYLDGTADLTLDLADGDVTLVMDGNLGLKNTNLNVINGNESGNVARIYFNHTDMAMANGAGVAVESDQSQYLQIYGTSDMQFSMGQSNKDGFTGVIYAPRDAPDGSHNDAVQDMGLSNAECSTDICFAKGSGEVTGAVIAGDITIEQNTNFTYDPGLQYVEPSVDDSALLPPPITYLHVSVNEVDVEETS